MKNKIKKQLPKTDFDTVKTFRDIKEKISLELSKMSFEQIKEYLKTNSAKLNTELANTENSKRAF
jgi:hypothetical protein